MDIGNGGSPFLPFIFFEQINTFFSLYKIVVVHTCFLIFIRHGEHMAMAAADAELELDLFGPTTMLEAFDQVVVHGWVRFRVFSCYRRSLRRLQSARGA